MGAGPRDEIDALAAEGARTSALLDGLSAREWDAPTRCTPWSVREVVIHMITMMEYMRLVADEEPPLDIEPVKDRAKWWDYDIEEDKADSLVFMQEAEKDFAPGPLAGRWRSAIDDGVAAVRAVLSQGDPVVRRDTPIRASEYIATRALEITIHTMDVRDALGLAPDPTPEGLAAPLDILRRRLGHDPTTLGFDPVDFVLLSTGRRDPTDEDRERLGASAALLPLLA